MKVLTLESLQVIKEEKRKAPQILLDGVQFQLDYGESLGVLAESQAGKTLLLQAIVGTLNPQLTIQSGSIFLQGKERRKNSQEMAEIVLVPENASQLLPPFLSVIDFAAAYVKSRVSEISQKEAQERLLQRSLLLGFLPLERYHIEPSQLTLFERVAMVIAIATLLDPMLLLVDSALDVLEPEERNKLIEGMQNLLDAGVVKSIVFATRHDKESLRKFCTHTMVLYAGQVMEYGRTEQVLNYPSHPCTQYLFSHSHESRRASVLDASPTGGCKYANVCPLFQPDCIQGKIQFRTVHDHDVRCLLTPIS